MKVLLKSLLLLLLASPAIGKVRLGLEAGVNISRLSVKDYPGGISPNATSRIGLRAGAIADIALGDHLAVQPGLFYSMEGGKLKFDFGFLGSTETDWTFNYLDIPVLVVYKFDAGPGRIFAGLGPNLGIGLSNTVKLSYASPFGAPEDTSYSIEYGSDSTQVKRIDLAAVFNAGYELDMGVFIRVGYHLGLLNINNTTDTDKSKLRNNAIVITVGYILGRRDERY